MTNRSQSVKISSAISGHVVPKGGIPQGTKLPPPPPLRFAVLVNNLARQWKIRAKYVDDLSVVEIIPRCSTSFLPFIARDICTYASEHDMRLNPVKCKEMFIDFLHHKPHHPPPSESEIERVHTNKLLGVYVTDNLCWSTYCEYIVQRVRKRLYALRCLKKPGVMVGDLVLVYSSLIRSVLEYASPVWANFTEYLSLLIEGVQKKALER